MEKLNPSQERAVRHFGRPLLVIAGAGSGKTKTLAHKVEFLIKEKSIRPSNLLAITFTNKASREIRERVKKVAGVDLPWSGTFHSIALRLLKERGKDIGLDPSFSLLSEGDRDNILKRIAQARNINPEKLKAYILERIENLKPQQDQSLEDPLREYLGVLKEMKLMDFSSLMLYLFNLLRVKPSIKDSFSFILVDEFQDTNTVQYEILRIMIRDKVCVIGDPNQCIYEWRYAKPDNILRFKEDFQPDIIKLEYNYRSKPYILYTANSVLQASTAPWKELIPLLKPTRQGEEKPIVKRFEGEEDEAIGIAEKIRDLLSQYKPSQVAILVRVGHITDAIERALHSLRIPYKVVGAVRFFERSEIKDCLSFLRLLVNPYDRISFERALGVATHGIGEKSIELIAQMGGGNFLEGSRLALNKLPQSKAMTLFQFLKNLSALGKGIENYPFAFESFLQDIDFWSYLDQYKDVQEKQENVREFLKYLRQKHQEGYALEEVLQEIGFLLDREDQGNAVQIMTIHASKGLEFEVVFLPRLEEGILPHEKALESQEELEEELRLFYVAITRAKDLLFMSYTKLSKPSRFLSYINKSFLNLSAFAKKKTAYMPELRSPYKFKVGDQVVHEVFGVGLILSLENSRALVEFKAGKKTIHTAFLKLMV
ncbi:MAG: ATP-dependent helicase [Aquificaceae bacterium]